MRKEDVLEPIGRLDAAGIEWWVDGGWGVDALLGEVTRSHDDLDLAVRREDVARLVETFPEFGRINEHEWPSAFDAAGRRLDFHPLEFDVDGNGWQARVDGGRNLWSREALAAHGRIGGREARCTSPEFQVESHLFAGYDDIDWDDGQALCRRFGLEPPPGARRPGFLHERRGVS